MILPKKVAFIEVALNIMLTSNQFHKALLSIGDHRIQGSRRLADGGHSNCCQGAADFQIHLQHLLATTEEITLKSSLEESTRIYLAKYFYLHLYLYYIKKIYIYISMKNQIKILCLYIYLLLSMLNK